MFAKIGLLSPRLVQYQTLYVDSTRVQDALSKIFGTIIEFCSDVMSTINLKGHILFAKAIWKPFKLKFKTVLAKLDEQRTELDEEIRLESIKESKSHRELELVEHKKASVYRKKGYREMELAGEFRDQVQQYTKEQKRLWLLAKLSAHDNTRRLRYLNSRQHVGTGQWFLETIQIQSWLQSEKSTGVLCVGIPGSGKSILASQLIDRIWQSHLSLGSSLIYFFCDYQECEALQYDSILRSLLRQYLEVNHMEDWMRENLESIFSSSFIPIDSMERLFLETIGEKDELFIIIDGLEELESIDRRKLLGFLERLQRAAKAKIAIFSRPDPALTQQLSRFEIIKLSGQRNSMDIAKYVQDSIIQAIDEDRLVVNDPALIDEIAETLVERADGMFLLVYFLLIEVCSAQSDQAIRRILANLPSGISEVYTRITKKILSSQTEDNVLIARNILFWVATAFRPLSLDELREAITIEPSEALNVENIPNDGNKLVRLCGDLLQVDEDQKIGFVHRTVYEFLILEAGIPTRVDPANDPKSELQFTLLEAQWYTAQACVYYLNYSNFERQLVRAPKATALDRQPIALLSAVGQTDSISRQASSWAKTIFEAQRRRKSASTFNVTQSLQKLAVKDGWSSFTFLDYAKKAWPFHVRIWFDENISRLDKGFHKSTNTLDPFLEYRYKIRHLIRDRSLPLECAPWVLSGPSTHAWDEYLCLEWAWKNDNKQIFYSALIPNSPQSSTPLSQFLKSSFWDVKWRSQPLAFVLRSYGDDELMDIFFRTKMHFDLSSDEISWDLKSNYDGPLKHIPSPVSKAIGFGSKESEWSLLVKSVTTEAALKPHKLSCVTGLFALAPGDCIRLCTLLNNSRTFVDAHLLIELGADVNEECPIHGNLISLLTKRLSQANQLKKKEYEDMLILFLKAGANFPILADVNDSPLITAFLCEQPSIVEIFLDLVPNLVNILGRVSSVSRRDVLSYALGFPPSELSVDRNLIIMMLIESVKCFESAGYVADLLLTAESAGNTSFLVNLLQKKALRADLDDLAGLVATHMPKNKGEVGNLLRQMAGLNS
jgi:hypothetical protein